jgi:hypothetical protein
MVTIMAEAGTLKAWQSFVQSTDKEVRHEMKTFANII